MEDAYFYEEVSESECVFGILDGHGGRQISEFVAINLPKILTENLKQNQNLEDISELLIDTFALLDEKIKQEISSKAEECGTTCTIGVIRQENDQKVLYIANVGDSKAVLYSKNIEQLTVDHRASNEEEKSRIKNAGGFVSMGRIQGELEVSRAFGDLKYKLKGVSIIPYISKTILEQYEENAIYNIVIASDGLWDYVDEKLIEVYCGEKSKFEWRYCLQIKKFSQKQKILRQHFRYGSLGQLLRMLQQYFRLIFYF
ncbi:protein phosphatase 2c, putative [Ichthyophthirius multifiliis]|uniref:protein-serine/threonine phosphatase n=1 Tax=Ichthyophthirius multifiliis TaxID=5932 RepID=G0QS61_ICHMU|nr:protein phosphatase 2c, putative [Ichthyophthirius multifiliis]EGR31926.1 protein phosphatase 2c, putative [Ichthyophthirius multifiliis]|eukprot:XP_004035412.1 protein phosphatase 2c, putative [Ichthyophthirius multifiliis]